MTLPIPQPLPPPPLNDVNAGQTVSPALVDAWTQHMVDGFRNNERMLETTLNAFMKPYRLTVGLYAALFLAGLGMFIVAAVIGLRNGSAVVSIVFGGLGASAFLAFFIRQPLQALEENLECITWLGVTFNTYWTRLMYMSDSATVQEDLKAAESDFRASIEQLIARHAELRGKRSGVRDSHGR